MRCLQRKRERDRERGERRERQTEVFSERDRWRGIQTERETDRYTESKREREKRACGEKNRRIIRLPSTSSQQTIMLTYSWLSNDKRLWKALGNKNNHMTQ